MEMRQGTRKRKRWPKRDKRNGKATTRATLTDLHSTIQPNKGHRGTTRNGRPMRLHCIHQAGLFDQPENPSFSRYSARTGNRRLVG